MASCATAKNTKYRIKVSAVRQETIVVSARSEDAALNKLNSELANRVNDDEDALEHFVICSVEAG